MFTQTRSVLVVIMATLILAVAQQQTQAQTYSGRATAIKSRVITGILPGITTAVSDTGPLPSAGSTITMGSASANVTNILGAGASTVTTSGSGSSSQSTASIASLDVNALGIPGALRIRADAVGSNTTCTCPLAACTGGSTITNLRLGEIAGGTLITVTGDPNQTLIVTAGTVTLTLVINEQISSPSSLTVNALHISLADSLTGVTTDVIVSSAHSDISCTPTPALDRYSGQAYGVRLATSLAIPATNAATLVSDTGYLPTSGGVIGASIASVSVPGTITTGAVASNTSGGVPGGNIDTSQSDATVNNLSVSLIGNVQVTATVVQSNTQCQCSVVPTICNGSSLVTDINVVAGGIGVPIVISGSPNQVVALPLGLGSITINEQLSAAPSDITVNALHVVVTPIGLATTDLVVASSHSDLDCSLAPTAANASVAGRVVTGDGVPIANTRITITDQKGISWFGTTNLNGHYSIEELPVGRTYLVTAGHRRFIFSSRVISLEENVSGIDFVAEQ